MALDTQLFPSLGDQCDTILRKNLFSGWRICHGIHDFGGIHENNLRETTDDLTGNATRRRMNYCDHTGIGENIFFENLESVSFETSPSYIYHDIRYVLICMRISITRAAFLNMFIIGIAVGSQICLKSSWWDVPDIQGESILRIIPRRKKRPPENSSGNTGCSKIQPSVGESERYFINSCV